MTLLDQPLYDIDDFSIAGIVLPGDPAWDEARQAWNLAVDQHPVAVATPETVEGVAAAVRYAA
jgi:FAD/FMN-containing dehydrogenase